MAGKSKGKGVRNSRSLRFLFASGILRGSGKGKERSVSYNAKRAKSIAGQRKRGVNVTKKYRNTPKGSTRPVIGGSKAARLRGGGGAGKAAPKSRAERIAAGRKTAEKFAIGYTKRNLPDLKGISGTYSNKLASRVKRGSLERTKDPTARFGKVREATRFTAQSRAKWRGKASEKL